jgi:YjbE family integral membrane protein
MHPLILSLSSIVFVISQIILVDIILSGDNAVVIGMVANGVDARLRNKVIIFGMVFAFLLRIIFTGIAGTLMNYKIIGLVGGFGLLIVDYKLLMDLLTNGNGEDSIKPKETVMTAIVAIGIADLTMSIDNILAIAAITRDNLWIMIFGLALSIGIMGVGAKVVSVLMERWKWLSYIGVILILYIALKMIIINYDAIPLDDLIKKFHILLS